MDGNARRRDDRLAAWRAQQLDRHDPVRFAFLDALQRRAQFTCGTLRAVLDARLDALLDDYAERLRATTPTPTAPSPAPAAEALARLARPRDAGNPVYPALPALATFRSRWAQLRTAGQVRQTLAQTPSDGGPLNSSVLVHRAIGWMGEVSPGYLEHFLAYVDNLAWLEHMQQRGSLPTRDSSPGGAPGRSPSKPRRSRTTR